MFLTKIDTLTSDWNKLPEQMDLVARESLLYGMRLVKSPSSLKRELKKVCISSKIARPLWSGNAYLLITLPQVLTNKRKKIPCLSDFLFARKVLTKEHLIELKSREKNRSKISREEMFKSVQPNLKHYAYKGRFLPKFDGMYEDLRDVEQELAVRALEVLNKEATNIKAKNKEQALNYLGFCVSQKSKTFLTLNSPKNFKAKIEAEDFENIVHRERESQTVEEDYAGAEMRSDLRKIVSPVEYTAISLLLNFADKRDERAFNRFLRTRHIKREWTSQARMKKLIEKHLGVNVFDQAATNDALYEFLTNRVRLEAEDDSDGGYAECAGY